MADLLGGTDKTIDADDAAVHKQLRNFGDTSNVFVAVIFRKPKVVVDAGTDIVAIKHLGEVATFVELVFDMCSYSGLTRA